MVFAKLSRADPRLPAVAVVALVLFVGIYYINHTHWSCLVTHCNVRGTNANWVLQAYYIFYAWLGAALAGAAAVQLVPSLRRFSSARPTPRLLCKIRLSFTYGELFLGLYFSGLFIFWTVWFYQNTNVKSKTNVRAARLLGRLSELLIGLTCIPVSRNAAIQHLLGISSKTSVRFHRLLGNIFFLIVTGHLITYWISFAVDDKRFMYFAFYSNRTIAGMKDAVELTGEVAWLCFFMVFATSFERIRRRFFEVFWYSHALVASGIVLACLHADSVFLYVLPGLALYCVDAFYSLCTRFWRVRILEASMESESVLRLVLHKRGFNGTVHFPGQYVRLNVPSVSLLQWHALSVSSTTSEAEGLAASRHCGGTGSAEPGDVFTLHVRLAIAGRRSWTARLARSLASADPAALAKTLAFVDGPFGGVDGAELEKCETLVCVAGGIGLTPLPSILAWVAALGPSSSCKRIHAFWCIRDTDKPLLESSTAYKDAMAALQAASARGVEARLAVHVSGIAGVRVIAGDGDGVVDKSVVDVGESWRPAEPPAPVALQTRNVQLPPLSAVHAHLPALPAEVGTIAPAVPNVSAHFLDLSSARSRSAIVPLATEKKASSGSSSPPLLAKSRLPSGSCTVLDDRLDVDRAFAELEIADAGAGRTAVFACGPPSLVAAADEACQTVLRARSRAPVVFLSDVFEV